MRPALSHRQALRMMESSYLAAAAALIWLALYYLPVGGALFRLALPLPLALLAVRRGARAGVEGLTVAILLLIALMGPVRGPLMLFPYGLLSVWLGWCWLHRCSWWLSWGVGLLIGAGGFLASVDLNRQASTRGASARTRCGGARLGDGRTPARGPRACAA